MDVVVPINWVAVLLAALSTMVVGSVWFGPLFGKLFMSLTGMTPEKMEAAKKGMWKLYAGQLLGSFVMATVLAHHLAFAAAFMKEGGVGAGLQGGFWLWLGFAAPVLLGAVLWEGKPMKWFWMNAGYYLANLLVMGAILGAMPVK